MATADKSADQKPIKLYELVSGVIEKFDRDSDFDGDDTITEPHGVKFSLKSSIKDFQDGKVIPQEGSKVK